MMVKYIEKYSPIQHYMKAKPCWHGMKIGICKLVHKIVKIASFLYLVSSL
jgi:hypothetical protein